MAGTFDITSRVEFKPEDVLPMNLIREHTKTDDTPQVTDAQIELYRDTAFEQAEKYTGRIILGYAGILERFHYDASEERRPKRYRRFKLSYLPIDKYIVVSDPMSKTKNRVEISKNSRKIDIPNDFLAVNMGNCCAGQGLNLEGITTYTTGYRSKEDIPSTILYGCLKFIAWAVSNPGDELLTVRNRLGTTETGLIGTNNGAWASGAIEHWRGYKVD
jgi:hypothetical protein